MSLSRIFVLLCALTVGWCKNNNGFDKKIVIVGAGASGIAAATKLYENGFHNIVILEGESRLGGRINSFKYGKFKKYLTITVFLFNFFFNLVR